MCLGRGNHAHSGPSHHRCISRLSIQPAEIKLGPNTCSSAFGPSEGPTTKCPLASLACFARKNRISKIRSRETAVSSTPTRSAAPRALPPRTNPREGAFCLRFTRLLFFWLVAGRRCACWGAGIDFPTHGVQAHAQAAAGSAPPLLSPPLLMSVSQPGLGGDLPGHHPPASSSIICAWTP